MQYSTSGAYGLSTGLSRPEKKVLDGAGTFGPDAQVGSHVGRHFMGTLMTKELVSPGATGIPGGTGVNQRVGNRITLKSVVFDALVRLGDAVLADGVIEASIVLDTQVNGAFAAFTDIYEAAATASNDITQLPRKLENAQRFRVLWSQKKPFRRMVTPVTSSVPVIHFQKFLALPSLVVNYLSADGLYTSIRDNALLFVVRASDGVTLSSASQVTGRLRYIDN